MSLVSVPRATVGAAIVVALTLAATAQSREESAPPDWARLVTLSDRIVIGVVAEVAEVRQVPPTPSRRFWHGDSIPVVTLTVNDVLLGPPATEIRFIGTLAHTRPWRPHVGMQVLVALAPQSVIVPWASAPTRNSLAATFGGQGFLEPVSEATHQVDGERVVQLAHDDSRHTVRREGDTQSLEALRARIEASIQEELPRFAAIYSTHAPNPWSTSVNAAGEWQESYSSGVLDTAVAREFFDDLGKLGFQELPRQLGSDHHRLHQPSLIMELRTRDGQFEVELFDITFDAPPDHPEARDRRRFFSIWDRVPGSRRPW